MKPTGPRSEPGPVFIDKQGSDITYSDRAAARADMPQPSARQTEPTNPAMMASSILAFSSAAILMMWTPLHRPTTATQLVDQSKQGDRYLCRLLVVGAAAVMRHIKDKPTPMNSTA